MRLDIKVRSLCDKVASLDMKRWSLEYTESLVLEK